MYIKKIRKTQYFTIYNFCCLYIYMNFYIFIIIFIKNKYFL